MDVQQLIKEQVTNNPVVLYMKGTPQFPQCGFSAVTVQILKACGVSNFLSVNVLEDAEIRSGIKEYANWPTIPQLYVRGEFVGGCDIMREMYEDGELQKLLEAKGAGTSVAARARRCESPAALAVPSHTQPSADVPMPRNRSPNRCRSASPTRILPLTMNRSSRLVAAEVTRRTRGQRFQGSPPPHVGGYGSWSQRVSKV